MKQSGLIRQGGLIAMFLLVTACGGGGGSSPASESTYVGTITGFGSIFVNGVEFETEGSRITVDGEPASEDDLKVGMRVRVEGRANGGTGHASTIAFSDELEGIVISNNIPTGQTVGDMNIMGQQVTVSQTTIFESKVAGVVEPDQVAAGMVVEVSGHTDGMGSIQATRLEVKASDLMQYLALHPQGIEVKGVVTNHDMDTMKFDIGDMTVDYSSAILDDMPAGSYDMLYVEVKSTAGLDPQSGELLASKVEPENDGLRNHHGDDHDELEIKGMITSAFDGDSFAVDGQAIVVTDSTEYEHISSTGLELDVRVKVEGYYLNGELVATEIEAEDESSDEISGIIADISLSATNTGSVTLQDDTVIEINSNTIMKDSRDEGYVPDDKFNLESLVEGDFVEIHYYMDNGQLVASKLERDDM